MISFKNILLIDDDTISNFITEKLILRGGFAEKVTCFLQADAALKYLQNLLGQHQPPPCLILLDLNMPEMDGWEFLDAYRQLPESFTSQSQVYLLSSAVDAKEIAAARSRAEVEDFISKPLTLEDLAIIQERMLNGNNWEGAC